MSQIPRVLNAMIKSLYIDNYRSVRKLFIDLERLNIVFGPNGCGKSNIYQAIQLIHSAATGQLAYGLAAEGGMQKAIWAGERARGYASAPRRITLAVETDTFEYQLELGFPLPVPYPTMFNLDPVVKSEQIWLSGYQRRPSASILQRSNQSVFLKDIHGEKVTHAASLYENESLFGQLSEPHRYPEVSRVRETLRNWRFYHEFDISKGAGLRVPQVGYRSPVLSGDGLNLAAAFQTIVEVGDVDLLFTVLEEAFPECTFYCDNSGGRFQMMMKRQGIHRPLGQAEFSDGTLRFLCLAVALQSPRPPYFIALNEPENSLHPRMLPALARLIAEASRYTQIWLTSHSPELATLIGEHAAFSLYQLDIERGETRIHRLS